VTIGDQIAEQGFQAAFVGNAQHLRKSLCQHGVVFA